VSPLRPSNRVRWIKRCGSALLGGAILLSLNAAPAGAASTRGVYVAQADAICASYKPRQAALVSGFKKRYRQNKKEQARRGVPAEDALTANPSPFAWYQGRLNKVIERMTAQLAGVSAAPGDEQAVFLWLQGRRDYQRFARPAVRNLKRRKLRRGVEFLIAAAGTFAEADSHVTGWGFAQCVTELK
jgi:hypothetical protein